jgi:hypothetical protein
MENITFTTPKKLIGYLKARSYLAKKYFLTIHVENSLGYTPSGAVKTWRSNILRVYDSELNKQSSSLIKRQVEVERMLLTNKLYSYLEEKLEIKTQYYHTVRVADFCHELTPLKVKLKNFLAYLKEPDAVEILESEAETLQCNR